MPVPTVLRRTAWFLLTALGCLLLILGCAWLLAPDLAAPPPQPDPADLARVEELREVELQVDDPPVIWQEVDYGQGSEAAWWPRGEAPVLADLSAAGELPPVAERTGPEPLVLEGCDGIGRYGGTWFRLASGPDDTGVMGWRLSGACLVRWSPMGHPVVPHVAKDWDVDEAQTRFTFYLRRGMRWSDGHPFTSEDVRFWWEDDILALGLGNVPKFMRVGGEPGDVEIIDDYTIRFVFPAPHPLFLELLAKEHSFALPSHYLLPYHPDKGDRDLIASECERRGLSVERPRVLYGQLKRHDNVHHPRLWPWIYRQETANAPFVWVRNPYYWVVDSAGNQLPYIDQIHFAVKQGKLISTAAAQGEVGMQRRHIKFQDYVSLMNGRRAHPNKDRHFEVFHWYPATRSEFTIFPNINRRVDEGDAHAAAKQLLLADRRFRQALSLAIDRDAVIRAFYAGQADPAQLDPGPDSPFHSPALYRSYTRYDPDQAGALLDACGLTERDADGFRLGPDGQRLSFYLNTCSEWTGEGPGPFVIEDWRRVGLRVTLRDRARALFNSEKQAYQHDFTVWTGESEYLPLLEPRNFMPTYIESFFAPAWGIWYQKTGLSEDPETRRLALEAGAQPIPANHPLLQNLQDYQQLIAIPDRERQIALWHRIAERCAENVWTISICTHPPQPVVVAEAFQNVPETAIDGAGFYTPGNTGIETYWIQEELDGEAIGMATVSREDGAYQALRQSMLSASDRYATTSIDASGTTTEVDTDGGIDIGFLFLLFFWGSLGIFILLMAVRHPFVMRRLLIMVPTLLVISVIGFTVIQLPPGDYLETKIAELRLKGDEGALQQAQELREVFHYDEPQVLRYARWMGFVWFTSFKAEDRGLLQGDLGRSMQNGKRVNEMVGDRVVLTMLIAFLSILLTWAIALVTGTYSAVRQYTVGDYTLTLISFIGMSVPGFLLALVLIYVAKVAFGISITGLFSPDYAAAPDWSWGKVIDLLQHIWVPVLVAGIGGTAGLFRVMRGNLLDELRKPYVTTARAKGVRPIKLLVKYPVRVALNPVISTIGGIFPELISGSAIVAIVLSLPTVGPLMLEALMLEDMLLAGSMLMVLSLLGIFGTLVSDLLLLWLDPRIRFEGGGK